jgi:glutathione S-transferase
MCARGWFREGCHRGAQQIQGGLSTRHTDRNPFSREQIMLKVFGTKASRASRALWMCRELGIPHEHVEVHFADGSNQTPQFLAVNPNGKIPAIDDEGFRLWESMAINIYLAKKHGSPLMPRELQQEMLVLQWSFWVMAEVEKPLLTLMLQRLELPEGSPAAKYLRERNPKDPAAEKLAIEALDKPLGVLEQQLSGRDYLLGSDFTVADLNVASVLSWAIAGKLDLSARPNVLQWLKRCTSRPAMRG